MPAKQAGAALALSTVRTLVNSFFLAGLASSSCRSRRTQVGRVVASGDDARALTSDLEFSPIIMPTYTMSPERRGAREPINRHPTTLLLRTRLHKEGTTRLQALQAEVGDFSVCGGVPRRRSVHHGAQAAGADLTG
jgi:hypothetical protein